MGVGGDVGESEVADAFGLPCAVAVARASFGDEGAELAVGCAVAWVGEERFACDEGDADACEGADVYGVAGGVVAHDACEAVDIATTKLVIALRPCGCGEVYGVRGAAQEGKAGGEAKFHKGGWWIGGVVVVLYGAAWVRVIVFGHNQAL